jgi:hypothetical protein
VVGLALAPMEVLEGVVIVFVFCPWMVFAPIQAWQSSETKKAETAARAVMVAAAPAERPLLCHRPTNIGNVLRRRVWIATDRRLFLVDRTRGDLSLQRVRSVEYPQITALSCKQSGEDHTRIELRLGSRQLDLTLKTEEAEALLAILCRRTGLPALRPVSRYADWRSNMDRLIRGRGL